MTSDLKRHVHVRKEWSFQLQYGGTLLFRNAPLYSVTVPILWLQNFGQRIKGSVQTHTHTHTLLMQQTALLCSSGFLSFHYRDLVCALTDGRRWNSARLLGHRSQRLPLCSCSPALIGRRCCPSTRGSCSCGPET